MLDDHYIRTFIRLRIWTRLALTHPGVLIMVMGTIDGRY